MSDGDTYNPRYSVLEPELIRLQHILELVRSALRDDLVPRSVVELILSYVIESMVKLGVEGNGEWRE